MKGSDTLKQTQVCSPSVLFEGNEHGRHGSCVPPELKKTVKFFSHASPEAMEPKLSSRGFLPFSEG